MQERRTRADAMFDVGLAPRPASEELEPPTRGLGFRCALALQLGLRGLEDGGGDRSAQQPQKWERTVVAATATHP